MLVISSQMQGHETFWRQATVVAEPVTRGEPPFVAVLLTAEYLASRPRAQRVGTLSDRLQGYFSRLHNRSHTKTGSCGLVHWSWGDKWHCGTRG